MLKLCSASWLSVSGLTCAFYIQVAALSMTCLCQTCHWRPCTDTVFILNMTIQLQLLWSPQARSESSLGLTFANWDGLTLWVEMTVFVCLSFIIVSFFHNSSRAASQAIQCRYYTAEKLNDLLA